MRTRVWHIPQIPMEPFTVGVDDYAAGEKVIDVLADYDLFQFENNVKPDYSNASGIQVFCTEENDWVDVEDADEWNWYNKRRGDDT